jgi:hypothetical protein
MAAEELLQPFNFLADVGSSVLTATKAMYLKAEKEVGDALDEYLFQG